ncbi:CHRD domain-containing protein [Flagellimonas sp.]|uniref:CHRD domain-containing protein n=1 Tax=Flagellimonas sp. TaxID=2058762 RepID=UPI003B50A860
MKTKFNFVKVLLCATVLAVGVGCSENDTVYSDDENKLVAAKASLTKFNFNTSLKGRNEVPAVDSQGTGQASVKIAKDEKSIYFKVTASNVENVRAMHFHMAPAGQNGGVVAFLFSNPNQPSGPQNGVLAEGTLTEANVIGALAGDLDGLIEAIRSGNIYVNLHTSAVPSGELRGQL